MKYITISLSIATLFILGIVGCGDRTQKLSQPAVFTLDQVKAASQRANFFFDAQYEKFLSISPERQARLGHKENYTDWDELTEEHFLKEKKMVQTSLLELQKIKLDTLDSATKISYKLLEGQLKQKIADYEFRHYRYWVSQMGGVQAEIPAFLINVHRLDTTDAPQALRDAEAYIKRIEKIPTKIDQLLGLLVIQEREGAIPPKFVLEKVVKDCENLLEGYPLTEDKSPKHKKIDRKEHPLYEDFKAKLSQNKRIPTHLKDSLTKKAETALLKNFKPAYEKLTAFVKQQITKANDNDGVWRFKNGSAYYDHLLKRTTTTNLNAEEIHQIGLKEIERIHKEMEALLPKMNFEGDLKAFFDKMRTDKTYFYPNTEEGKNRYLREATAIIDDMRQRLDSLFISKPISKIMVKRVESFREATAGKAFYEDPAPDGSRPGIYYVNLYDMNNMPTYQMEALAYHEGIPGHHMQIAIAQEMKNLPKFRRFSGEEYIAYIEGWGLYAELIPKEMGLYKNVYSDFGRLAMELWRACRLVVDTGIHAKKWTRQEGIDFYMKNSPNPEGDCKKMVDRHIVMPSQATAYKIGMIKILELREKAKKEMQMRFDIRRFHEVLLTNGALPLDVLEDLIEEYINLKSE